MVWLALLLPMAQTAATWHAYSHHGLDTSAPGERKQSPHALHCNLCLTAAAVSGGGLPSQPFHFERTATIHPVPLSAQVGVWIAPPTQSYLSRAPPLSRS
jgi:hypothetical protein